MSKSVAWLIYSIRFNLSIISAAAAAAADSSSFAALFHLVFEDEASE